MVDEADEETYDDPNLKDYQIRINNGRVIPMRRAESLATPTSARMAGGQDMPRHQSMAPQQHASNGSQCVALPTAPPARHADTRVRVRQQRQRPFPLPRA